jgi:hypothetical protein
MKHASRACVLLTLACLARFPQCLCAQEAGSGLDLRATLTAQGAASSDFTEEPRSGSGAAAGFRGVLYPTWKIDEHWNVTAALQLVSRPYFVEEFSTPGYGMKGEILQASLNYARVSEKGSMRVQAGELSTAFGAFLQRYDDAENAVIDLPMEYGYYYTAVSFLPVAGAQMDVTRGKWDARAQFANSSPANPRSLLAHDQYGNWAGGVGYTVRQGLRVGVSGYRGPYLSRNYQYFLPGEANPNTLPAKAIGVDAAWSRGHWNAQGEWQKFLMPYTLIPDFREQAGYGEVKRVLNPRWYVAGRVGYTRANATGNAESFEGTAGFRVNRNQLLKFGYEHQHYSTGEYRDDNTALVQFVTSLHASVAGK